MTGECEECGTERLSLQRISHESQLEAGGSACVSSIENRVLRSPGPSLGIAKRISSGPRFGHDFSRVSVRANTREPTQSSSGSLKLIAQHQLPDERGAKAEYSTEGLMLDFDGSGTCQNGGASSVCDPVKGTYGLVENGNTCCTKGCTAEHEAEHAKDHDSWGCCKAVGVAWNAKGADKPALAKKYNDWSAKVSPITECHAYSHDVKCAAALSKTKDCAGAGKNTDCCKDIDEYKTKYAALAKTNCDAAPKKPEPCPTF